MGKDITNDEIEHIMVKHDFSGDKQISLEEFKEMMLAGDVM
jgi:Ca2+-binding EF-hand superfamily protein